MKPPQTAVLPDTLGAMPGDRVDPDSAAPAYVQISDQIRRDIIAGRLRGRMPTEQQLTKEWGVARATITKALDLLRAEGYVESWQGRGTFAVYPPKPQPRKDS